VIEIQRSAVDGVRAARKPSDLHEFLAAAMRLEHATVPLYLTAYFSLKPGANSATADLIRSVVIEEMLHLSIVANVLNAVGGRVEIDNPASVPYFPGPLPMGVAGDLEVHLGPMSMDQCATFMQIEQPEDPIARGADADLTTIGDFYDAIIDKIRDLGEPAFATPSAPQVTSPWFPSTQLFAVTDVTSAVRALTIIVRQGEGTTSSPEDGDGAGELAHYYRFAEIRNGHRLIPDPTAPDGFSFTGDPVVFDESQVYPMIMDPTTARYPVASAARRLAEQFSLCYRRLLTSLQETFSGHPAALNAAMGLMYELRLMALAMAETPDPTDPTHCVTPSWEYPTSLG